MWLRGSLPLLSAMGLRSYVAEAAWILRVCSTCCRASTNSSISPSRIFGEVVTGEVDAVVGDS